MEARELPSVRYIWETVYNVNNVKGFYKFAFRKNKQNCLLPSTLIAQLMFII